MVLNRLASPPAVGGPPPNPLSPSTCSVGTNTNITLSQNSRCTNIYTSSRMGPSRLKITENNIARGRAIKPNRSGPERR